MLQSHKYIENIDNIVKTKLKELELKPLKKLLEFIKKNKRFYSTPCLREREKLFLKILITNETAPIEAIQREIEIRKFLSTFKKEINTTPLVEYDNKNFPYWYLSQYAEGKLLGYFYEIWLKNRKYIPLLIDILFALQKVPQNELKKIFKRKGAFLWRRDFFAYLKMIKDHESGINKKIVKEIDFKKIYDFFNEKKEIFSESPLILAHGDFTLANFISTREKLFIVDWEHAHLDNFVYDLSHLWIQLWKYPNWRKELIFEFISRLPKDKVEELKDLFRVVIISEALGELRWSINLCDKKYKKSAAKAVLKTMNAALLGFNNLIIL